MKNLLYIGNNLNTAKANISSIQVLGVLLESEGYNLCYASSKRNKLLRLLDMLWSCIWNSKWADAVLIDTLPDGVTFNSNSLKFNGVTQPNPAFPTINLPDLGSGSVQTVSFQVTVCC